MGFTFNGISSKSMGIATRMDTENRMPELRNQTDTVAGRHGLLDFGQTLSERKIEIDCLIPPGRTVAGLLKLKDQLMEWLNPSYGLCPLLLDSEPDRQYQARIYSGISFERMVRTTGTFKLSFFCPDPFAYAIPDETYELTDSADIVRKLGNYDSAPLYEIKGHLADKSQWIRIYVNREEMAFQGPLLPTETLLVDAEDMTAKMVTASGKERNALGQMAALHFPYLKTGRNTVTIGTTGGSLSLVTIHARSRWL